jgi:hypothetical protein
VTETRVKVYRTQVERQADEGTAAAHGWTVASSETQPDGSLKVTYQHGSDSEWAVSDSPASPAPPPDRSVTVRVARSRLIKAFGSAVAGVLLLAFLWWLLGSPPLDDILETFRDMGQGLFGRGG